MKVVLLFTSLKDQLMKISYCILSVCLCFSGWAQYAPPAGILGTTAIYKDSSVFKSWAKSALINRGPMDISDPLLGLASVGDSSSCIGKSNGLLVSLGDGGEAIISFELPIFDGPSWDFAVFENSFLNNFLELAFVEVSSDGQNFFRFPASSFSQDTVEIGAFGLMDARKINNLAGKYEGSYGTPFDLAELSGIPGLDIQNISHVKIIDVVGGINPLYATQDTAGNYINDPWPSPFPSSGFDLEAIGVIHSKGFSLTEFEQNLSVYPIPAADYLMIQNKNIGLEIQSVEMYSTDGQLVIHKELVEDFGMERIDLNNLESGIYFILMEIGETVVSRKIQIVK